MSDHCPRCAGTELADESKDDGTAELSSVRCPRCLTWRRGSALPPRGRKPNPNALRTVGRTIPSPKVRPETYARYEARAHQLGLTLSAYVVRAIEAEMDGARPPGGGS